MDKAISYFKAAFERRGSNRRYTAVKGRTYSVKEKYGFAISDYKEALKFESH